MTSRHGQRSDRADPLAQFAPALAAVFALEQRAVAQTGEELSPSGGERVDEEFIESGELPPEQMIERARQLREEAELPEFEPYRRSHLIVAGRMEEAAQARLAATDQSGKR